MARRKRSLQHREHRPSGHKHSGQAFYTPFRSLDQHLAGRRTKAVLPSTPSPLPPRATAPQSDDGERLFREAMADVIPLRRGTKERVPPPPRTQVPPRFFAQEEIEAYTHLVDLVAGEGTFELSLSDEYVDGAVVGLSPEILKKLRRGEFSTQAYVDLHGHTREQAREVAVRFVERSFAQGRRCVLIVSGRGLNSKDRLPVLKQGLVRWLTRAPLNRLVLAFASARSYDGGAGAFYVLLRRNPGKAPFVSPAR